MNPTALIAEDEPLLAKALDDALRKAWRELDVVETVGDGLAAVERALALLPDVLFFDIRMPGQDGLAAAAALAEAWPTDKAFPVLVFVTAYDRYAVQAFEAQAADYVLKPIQPMRLQRTVARIQAALAQRVAPHDKALERLRQLLDAMPADGVPVTPTMPDTPLLRFIPAAEAGSNGALVRLVPVDDVLAFEAADKYVRVLTGEREYLVRTPLRDLLRQIDPQVFWQIHRGVLVRAAAIDTVERDDAGRLQLSVRGLDQRWTVSRLYAHQFRAL